MSNEYTREHITKKQAKKRYKGARNLQIEVDKNGFVEKLSYSVPCSVCGKYHRLFSKPSQRCGLILMGIVSNVINKGND